MMTRTNIHPSAPAAPAVWETLTMLFGRLVNRWIAGVIARCEREAALAALRQLDDRELKDMGIRRCQIGDALTEIARERTRLQRRRPS